MYISVDWNIGLRFIGGIYTREIIKFLFSIKGDWIVKSIKTVILNEVWLKDRLWHIATVQPDSFPTSRDASLRMTLTRLLPPKEGGQVITFYLKEIPMGRNHQGYYVTILWYYVNETDNSGLDYWRWKK